MISDSKTLSDEQLLSVPQEHSLTLSSSRKVTQNGTILETRWLEEHDEQQQLISRFRTWTSESLKPPYRKQLGWERFSASGHLLDREVRYSRRSTEGYLH